MRHLSFLVLFFITLQALPARLFKQAHVDSLKIVLNQQKGEKRVMSLLQLSDSYYWIQSDSSLLYAEKARKEAKKLDFEWGFYKSIYLYSKASLHHSSSLKNLFQIKKCITWFEANNFEKDALDCHLSYIYYLGLASPLDTSRAYFQPLWSRVKKTKDASLIGQLWYQ